jgi:hypothetical protein
VTWSKPESEAEALNELSARIGLVERNLRTDIKTEAVQSTDWVLIAECAFTGVHSLDWQIAVASIVSWSVAAEWLVVFENESGGVLASTQSSAALGSATVVNPTSGPVAVRMYARGWAQFAWDFRHAGVVGPY